jgi:hypothetical protein
MTTLSLAYSALPPIELDRIRARGVDDFGNDLVVTENQDAGGTPLRCCLREAAVGERVALLAWQPAPQPGAYAEVGPIFIHAQSCPGWSGSGYPEGFRHRKQLLRTYNADGQAVHHEVVEGFDAEAALERILAQPQVRYVHSRNPLAGCYMFSVTAGER